MEHSTPAADRTSIDIFTLRNGRKDFLAVKDYQAPFNIITRACIEQLEQPWYRFNDEINYKVSSHASAPIGHCKLSWTWAGHGSTWSETFVVVERATCGVILGNNSSQRPRTQPGGVYTNQLPPKSKEEAERQRIAGEQSAARQAAEKAQQDAKNRANREKEKEKKKRQDNNGNT